MDLMSKRIVMTNHFVKKIKELDFHADTVLDTLLNPASVYPSGSHVDQWRVTGNGLCMVGAVDGNTFTLITAYRDRVVTPVRPDQLDTPEGRRFAQIGRQ